MHIRSATTRDLHRLANITVTSLPDDPTFDWMWPHRREYPEDNFFFWQFRLQSLLYDKKFVFIVMVLDDDDEDAGLASRIDAPPGTIISYGIWGRFGKSKAAKKRWKAKNTLLNIVDSMFPSNIIFKMNLLFFRWPIYIGEACTPTFKYFYFKVI
jgi:hypothetical protein